MNSNRRGLLIFHRRITCWFRWPYRVDQRSTPDQCGHCGAQSLKAKRAWKRWLRDRDRRNAS